ncbi:NADH-quinone oxidoreductase subunit B family protein [Methanopyrus sp.]
MGKATVATAQLSSCVGCHVSLLDLHERLLDLLEDAIDLQYCYVVLDQKEIPEEVDVALIEGSIRNEEDLEVAEELREAAEVVVAVGTCACFGGVHGLANLYDREELLKWVYEESYSTDDEGDVPSEVVPELFEYVRPLGEVIDVDYMVPGCPPKPDAIAEIVAALLEDREPELPRTNLCEECPREKEDKPIEEIKFRTGQGRPDPDKCLLEQGYPCLGPATRAGCGAACPSRGLPCRGCNGPTEEAADQGAAFLDALASVSFEADVDVEELLEGLVDLPGRLYMFSLASSILKGHRDVIGGK